jgi:hypothetical protein
MSVAADSGSLNSPVRPDRHAVAAYSSTRTSTEGTLTSATAVNLHPMLLF